jgi:hypothetical protein
LLLTGEDPDDWEKLHAGVFAAVVPVDIFEKFWARDIVDHQWEILQLRRLRTGLFSAGQQQALENVLRPLMSNGVRDGLDTGAELLAWKFTLRHQEAVKEVMQLLETAGLTWDAVLAQTMTFNVADFERISLMCMRGEACRDGALREIDRRQSNPDQRMRRTIQQLKNDGYQMIQD